MPNYRWRFEAAPHVTEETRALSPEVFEAIWGPMLPSAARAKLHAQAHMLQQMASVYADHAIGEHEDDAVSLGQEGVADLRAEWVEIGGGTHLWELRNWGGARYLVAPAEPMPSEAVACIGPELTERDWELIRKAVGYAWGHVGDGATLLFLRSARLDDLSGLERLEEKLRRAE